MLGEELVVTALRPVQVVDLLVLGLHIQRLGLWPLLVVVVEP